MSTIVIIEDNQDIRDLVIYTLKTNQMEAIGFESGEDFFKEKLDLSKIDLILLDVMLPEEDGLSILKKIRNSSKYEDIPIIMLTAKSSEIDKVKALDLGADDYIVKPFGVLELIARISARLRRIKKDNILVYKGINLNQDTYEVSVNSKLIQLTNKEFDLLAYFLLNPNIVIKREKLLAKVWGYDFEGESRTLDIHISTLRKHLNDHSKYIQTVRSIGYKLGDVDE